MAVTYSIQVFDPKEWTMKFDGTEYDTTPKKCMPLKTWANHNNADISSNLCFFNFASAKYGPLYTLQTLYIPRLGGKCGAGECSTNELITLPNGDKVSGWSWRKDRLPVIKDDKFYTPSQQNTRSHNLFGITTGGKIIVAKSTRGTTEYTVAVRVQRFVKTYYKEGIALLFVEDAGGSTGLYSARAKLLFAPEKEGADGRYVCSVFCASYTGKRRINRTLKIGSNGEDVKLLQTILGGLECDGIYGLATYNKVKEAQRNLGFKGRDIDGIAGIMTLTALKLWANS